MPDFTPIIDHVVVNVRGELDAAAETYRRLGFLLTERGHHTLGSSNHLAVFDTNYLELLGFEPGREGARADLWQHPAGLSGLVFKPRPEAGFLEGLAARGLVTEPRAFSRPVRLPEGTKDAAFRTATLTDPALDAGRVFLCHHETPELVWREEWRRHPNGATSIAEFVIAAADPARSAAPLHRLFGEAALRTTEGGLALAAGSSTVLILTPEAAAARYGGPLASPEGNATSRFVALSLRAPQARAHLASAGIALREAPGGFPVVPPEFAFGTAIGFLP